MFKFMFKTLLVGMLLALGTNVWAKEEVELDSNVEVLVAIDESEHCTEVVDDGKPQPCKPGSSIIVYTMSLEEAEEQGLTKYVVASTKAGENRELSRNLAYELNQEIQKENVEEPSVESVNGCGSYYTNKSRSFQLRSAYIDTSVRYKVNYDCRISEQRYSVKTSYESYELYTWGVEIDNDYNPLQLHIGKNWRNYDYNYWVQEGSFLMAETYYLQTRYDFYQMTY